MITDDDYSKDQGKVQKLFETTEEKPMQSDHAEKLIESGEVGKHGYLNC